MLRTLTPNQNESELVRLCHQKSWNAVLQRCRSHPVEASPTDACLRGSGSGTALSLSVRGGAPRTVVEAVLAANPHQVAMTHRHRGSILHDALKHGCPDDVFGLLLSASLEYQASSSLSTSTRHSTADFVHSRSAESHHQPIFTHVSVQDRRFLRYPNLLGTTDDMNRTVLHLLVERHRRSTHRNNRRSGARTFEFFQAVIDTYPEAIQAKDVDGHTPLLLLLMTPRGPVVGGTIENDICRIVRLMLTACPGASSVESSRNGTGPAAHPESRRVTRTLASSPRARYSSSVRRWATSKSNMNAAPLPLLYAILHGRSLETIQLLLKDHRTVVGRPAGSLLVTNTDEVLLHVAVTTRAPTSILYQLTNDFPEAVAYPDSFGLTSMDWTWIRYCLDSHQNSGDASAIPTTRIISRRRLVLGDLADCDRRSLHNLASLTSMRFVKHSRSLTTTLSNVEANSVSPLASDSSTVPQNPVALRSLQEELLRRINVMVPVAASMRANATATVPVDADDSSRGVAYPYQDPTLQYPFSLLHAVCYVPCPNAFVHVALALDNPSTVHCALRSRDSFQGRLPLHYAAARSSHVAHVPTGVTSSNVQTIKEGSVVAPVAASFPGACRVTDRSGQLPLHIAINTYKNRLSNRHDGEPFFDGGGASEGDETTRSGIESGGTDVECDESKIEMVVEGLDVTQSLLGHFPGALERRDGVTGLFPWQQAGIISTDLGACQSSRCAPSTTLSFVLLRSCPTAGFDNVASSSRPSEYKMEP